MDIVQRQWLWLWYWFLATCCAFNIQYSQFPKCSNSSLVIRTLQHYALIKNSPENKCTKKLHTEESALSLRSCVKSNLVHSTSAHSSPQEQFLKQRYRGKERESAKGKLGKMTTGEMCRPCMREKLQRRRNRKWKTHGQFRFSAWLLLSSIL